ncbi:hypothetical protein ANO11243_001140 [Dothideomycetidae sp. 11243]|nr:hypothetical protein ANO11243_001140 [fungal sp. No.11243]
MRLSPSIWLPALAAVAQAASQSGQIYFYEQQPQTLSKHHAVDPKTAALILASRLGVAHYHHLGVVSDDALSAINSFGNHKKLFDSSASRTPVALLLVTDEGADLGTCRMLRRVEEKLIALDGSYTQKLDISSMPSLEKTSALFSAFAKQAAATQHPWDNSLDNVVKTIPSAALAGTESRQLFEQGYDVVLLVSPSKASSSSSYGRWTLPSNLSKRQAEEPLEELSSLIASDNDTDSSPPSRSGPGNTTVLAGILPVCYQSKSACESSTRNCTGHGMCRLAYTQRDNTGDDEGVPCYSCSCSPTIRQNADGSKKTTVWGGPACQKKDVTTPFWLFATFTVFFMFLISWAIGTIWSMGDEELPSVIGAGVSGVTRK